MSINYTPKVRPLIWNERELLILDQTKLPFTTEYIHAKSYEDVARAIELMQVRGAPAIGIAAAYGLCLSVINTSISTVDDGFKILEKARERLLRTRPTAINLYWALDRIMNKVREVRINTVDELRKVVLNEAHNIFKEEFDAELKMSLFGSELIHDGDRVLTHCNAGGLATGTGLGTALGVLKIAHFKGKKIHVYATETRPWLQGARLTVYELTQEGIPTTLITDNCVGYLMYRGEIDAIFVGADRILSDGHVINKIGTSMIAILAYEYGIPFYVVAPSSSFDLKSSISEVKIEERPESEVKEIRGVKITIDEVKVFNPVFDITKPKYVTAIITEKGIIYPPYRKNIPKVLKS